MGRLAGTCRGTSPLGSCWRRSRSQCRTTLHWRCLPRRRTDSRSSSWMTSTADRPGSTPLLDSEGRRLGLARPSCSGAVCTARRPDLSSCPIGWGCSSASSASRSPLSRPRGMRAPRSARRLRTLRPRCTPRCNSHGSQNSNSSADRTTARPYTPRPRSAIGNGRGRATNAPDPTGSTSRGEARCRTGYHPSTCSRRGTPHCRAACSRSS